METQLTSAEGRLREQFLMNDKAEEMTTNDIDLFIA
jgi:hypothetical protein